MPISAYSTTAGSNTSVAGINIAEGCPAANINNGMRAMMADTRSFYEAATWTDLGHTPTRTGATTFTINSDVTAYYIAGRRIRCTDSSTLYGTIASSSYSAPNTTVTVTLDSGSLSASLTAVAVSVIDPTGDPVGAAAITGNGVFSDSVFRVQDNGDATKQLAFEVSGITTGTTRTLTVRDVNGTLPVIQTADLSIPATSAGPSSITLAEDTDNGANTVQIIAPAAVTSNRVLTLPDATGTVILDTSTATTSTAGVVQLRNGEVIQTIYAKTSTAFDTTATSIPGDSTIPQNTEGTEILTSTITPISSTSKIRIRAVIQHGQNGGGGSVYALFRDSTANAIAATFVNANTAGSHVFTVVLDFEDTAGSTSATTYRIRGGGGYVNRTVAGANLGGVILTSLELTEIRA
jgi:hypothetical protein